MYSTIHDLYEWETISQYYLPISPSSVPKIVSHQGELTLALTVVLTPLSSLAYGVTLHVVDVRPATNTSCLTHPCQTISKYAHNLGQYFNSTNLMLQLFFQAIMDLTIASTHELELLQCNDYVVCSSHACWAYFERTSPW